jgi:GTP 3',8-cyclase
VTVPHTPTRSARPARPAPVSLRLSVTDLCDLRCFYCMPPGGVEQKDHDAILRFEEIVWFVRFLKAHFGLKKVRITGGEPLIRRGVVDLIGRLAAVGLDDLALTTNGQHLPDMAAELRDAGLDRINVSLDSLVPDRFHEITRGGGLQRTLAGIEAALATGLSPVKLNTVVLRGVNDDEVGTIARFALAHGCPVRFLELMPVGCGRPVFDELFVAASEVRQRLEESLVLTPKSITPGSSSREFSAVDGHGRQGVVGFISAVTHPFCSECSRLRLTADGQLIGCLADGIGTSIRDLLGPGGEDELVRVTHSVLESKRRCSTFASRRPMVAVGG